MFGYVKKILLDVEIEKNEALHLRLAKAEEQAQFFRGQMLEIEKRLGNAEEVNGELNKVNSLLDGEKGVQMEKIEKLLLSHAQTEIYQKALFEAESRLHDEVAKGVNLTQELSQVVEQLYKLRAALNDAESRYDEIATSKEFQLLKDMRVLQESFLKLKREHDDAVAHLENFKKNELEKIKSELDARTRKLVMSIGEENEKLTGEYNDKRLLLAREMEKVDAEIKVKKDFLTELNIELNAKKSELDSIETEIDVADELNTITTVFQADASLDSIKVKEMLDEIKSKQKLSIRNGSAWRAYEHIHWNDSLASGKAMQKRLGKFLLTAFNAEVDNIIFLAKKSGFHRAHRDIEQWFEKVNKLGSDWFLMIERDFLKLRLDELRIVIEYMLRKEFEKEEVRYVSESIREEKRVQKEIEAFVKSRERQEEDYSAQIKIFSGKMKSGSENEISNLKNIIEDLQAKLDRSIQEKQRAISLAQLTRSGHVYVISNEGSFGGGVYKIGMTRRLDPMDRIKELGAASVPFYFDVHWIIPSDDAPGLERELHKKFDAARINKDNYRREFFRVSIGEIEAAIAEIRGYSSLSHGLSAFNIVDADGCLDENQ